MKRSNKGRTSLLGLIRLLYECIELMKHGRITLPRPQKKLLIEVRSGKWLLKQLLSHVQDLFSEVEQAISSSPLPERVDRTAISKLVAKVHLDFWTNRKHLLPVATREQRLAGKNTFH